ncbi:POU domain, class 6, transcription factor 2-like [Palaemon carinicauda]|uniref:POU domain, class 6, transcription factor 2-like n=1 Tax=Palaemon carinicauda TaxID=392227 RepID=UPI0035B58B7F
MHAIPEEYWHEFQIHCLNLVHHYRQRRQLFQQPHQQPLMTAPGPQQQQPWQPSQQQQFWRPPQPATLQAPPEQQQQTQQPQQHRPASQPSSLTWMPPQSPQSSGQSSWPRTTEWEPGMPPAPSATIVQAPSPTTSLSLATLVQAPSPTPSLSSLSATFKMPLTPLSFLVLTLWSVKSNLEEGMSPSSLYTSKELNTPPVHQASPRSGTTTSKDTD